jgi:hypothetical protein
MGGWQRRGLLTLIFATCALSPMAASTGASAGVPHSAQVTFSEARQVYDTTWQRFGIAFIQGQLGAIEPLATPHVSEIVAASTGCGCSWATPDSKVYFSIPPQQGYPQSFLAQIATPAPPHSIYSPFITMVVFTKSAAKSPWKVAYFVRYAGTHKYLTRSIVGAAPPAPFDITERPADLAAFFTAMVTTGTPPPGDSWVVVNALAQTLQDYLNTKADVAAGGDQQQTTFTALDHSVAFAYPNGDIMCASYDSSSTVTPVEDAQPIVQPPDQSQWGALAPGTYSSLSKLGMNDMCFSVDITDNGSHSVTAPISFQGGVYQISGQGTP